MPAATCSFWNYWCNIGDRVERDDNILTLETGKVALDIPSPYAGRVLEIHVTEGDTVDEGAPLITLETA